MHGVASLLLLHRHTHTHKKLTWCFFYSSGILWAGSCTGGDCENSFVCLSVELASLVEKFLVDFDAAGWCDMLPLNSRAKPCVFNPPSSSTRDGGYVLCECFLVFSRFLFFFFFFALLLLLNIHLHFFTVSRCFFVFFIGQVIFSNESSTVSYYFDELKITFFPPRKCFLLRLPSLQSCISKTFSPMCHHFKEYKINF